MKPKVFPDPVPISMVPELIEERDDLQDECDRRRAQADELLPKIEKLRKYLGTPASDRPDLSLGKDEIPSLPFLDKAEKEYERLRDMLKDKMQDRVAEQQALLNQLWDQMHVPDDACSPSLRRMFHDDRVYVAVSVVATLGFLRGGEFTWSKGSCCRMLLGADLQVISSLGSPAVSVSIPRPKTRWWLPSVSVTCFQPAPGCFLDPAWLVNSMRNLAPTGAWMGPSDAHSVILTNGAPLSRSVAVTRTTELMTAANVQLLDHRGEPIDVKAVSWRAGGVASAKEVGLSDAVIMEMGRWTSPAWLHYSVTDIHDVRDAMRSMWVAACAPDILAGGHVVGVSAPADASDNDVVAQAQSLLASSSRSSYRRATE
jgi:hypothetical protein